MKVIGAGLPRTGTMSLKAALDQLQYPCYHMETLFKRPLHAKRWNDYLKGKVTMDWDWLFNDFQAAMDAPTCFYVAEILEKYPDAKVILSVREPEEWYRSWRKFRETSRRLRWLAMLAPHLIFVRHYTPSLLDAFGFDPLTSNKEEIIKQFATIEADLRKHANLFRGKGPAPAAVSNC